MHSVFRFIQFGHRGPNLTTDQRPDKKSRKLSGKASRANPRVRMRGHGSALWAPSSTLSASADLGWDNGPGYIMTYCRHSVTDGQATMTRRLLCIVFLVLSSSSTANQIEADGVPVLPQLVSD
ncbi:hypothetical protein RRG08_020674 [Elysia crispata]|uniref:Uncharacterized protein n=1 Tax=Elysia crispata TaxID=231223 RepID=A0AAE0Z4P2_9GAST|nr:hypothetical protein RRG08_020674 [Elysia crispata]